MRISPCWCVMHTTLLFIQVATCFQDPAKTNVSCTQWHTEIDGQKWQEAQLLWTTGVTWSQSGVTIQQCTHLLLPVFSQAWHLMPRHSWQLSALFIIVQWAQVWNKLHDKAVLNMFISAFVSWSGNFVNHQSKKSICVYRMNILPQWRNSSQSRLINTPTHLWPMCMNS